MINRLWLMSNMPKVCVSPLDVTWHDVSGKHQMEVSETLDAFQGQSQTSPGPTLKRLISYLCELYLMCKYLESTTAAKRFRSLEDPGKLQCTILRHSSSQNVGRDPPKPKPHPTSLNSLVSRLSCSLYDYCCCSCDRKKHFSCQNFVYFVLFWVKYQIILLLYFRLPETNQIKQRRNFSLFIYLI